MIKNSLIFIMLFAMTFNVAGCSVDRASSAGFVNTSSMHEDPTLPFQRVWIKPGFDKSKYNKLYVAAVDTNYMLEETDWQQGVRKGEMKEDVKQVAIYTREAIKKSFREDPNARFQIVNTPTEAKDALVIEVAIVEVVPSKVVLNALGYAPFGIGLGIKAVRMMAKDQSSVAIEARIRDASTHEIVTMIADRRIEQAAVISTNAFSWYSHAYNIIDAWAKEFVQIANRKPGETVEGMERFTLKPW